MIRFAQTAAAFGHLRSATLLRVGLVFAASGVLASCDFLFGSREDDVVQEIFEEGSIDPELFNEEVGYVPILPIWDFFENPIDVYVGYDEMVYVIDDNGVNVLDRAGTLHRTFPVQGATDIVQDRRLHTYVAGRIDFDVDDDGNPENLAAVYHFTGTSFSSGPVLIDTLIHPFCDDIEAKEMTNINDDADQVLILGVFQQAYNKGAVNLDFGCRNFLEIRER